MTYPGTNNFTDFTFDGLGRNVKIVETTAGSVTSTKQFVWCSDRMRPFRACEERDGTGALIKKFFERGQMNSTTKYFYNQDRLASVREMTDNSGVIQAQYVFDPYGQISKLQGVQDSDFQYSGYYENSRSNLALAKHRSYNSLIARWTSRDRIREYVTTNLYNYASNNPINFNDPSGLCACSGPLKKGGEGEQDPEECKTCCNHNFLVCYKRELKKGKSPQEAFTYCAAILNICYDFCEAKPMIPCIWDPDEECSPITANE